MSQVWRRALLLLRASVFQVPTRISQCRATPQNSLAGYSQKRGLSDKLTSTEKENIFLSIADPQEIDDLAPQLRPTFNLAAYANKSETLQELIKLGVDLTKWEKSQDVSSYILRLKFEEDMKPYISFLYDNGVPADALGRWLSVNPLIFKESIEDLETRINYLSSKHFGRAQITRIISRNPKWLLFNTVDIDSRLGFFQRTFRLTNNEVRFLTTREPRLITYDQFNIKKKNFSFLEEMGFTESEAKALLLAKPKLWMANEVSLMRRFDCIHNVIGLSHPTIVDFPKIFTCREFILQQRHGFLKLLGRDQYDPLKPNYVSPDALVEGNDVEFCKNVAKTSVLVFNNFLKTT